MSPGRGSRTDSELQPGSPAHCVPAPSPWPSGAWLGREGEDGAGVLGRALRQQAVC